MNFKKSNGQRTEKILLGQAEGKGMHTEEQQAARL